MKRRKFIQTTAAGVAAVHLAPAAIRGNMRRMGSIRFGGPVFAPYEDPEGWVTAHRELGYTAAYCPVKPGADNSLIRAYQVAAKKHNLIIAEVGAWSNPISPDSEEAAKAFEKCVSALQLAEQIGANCAVNISGSRNEGNWDGPHKDNLTPAVFDMIVESTRKIIDAVNPTRTFYTLEMMQWAYPDSTDSYVQLIEAIDRKQFGVHLDPVNIINSPRAYYENGRLIREMFSRLGPHIRSCHAKDVILNEDEPLVHLSEIRPGLGNLDYTAYLGELLKLNDVPLMMEHLKKSEDYDQSASYIRSVGASLNLTF